MKTLVLSLVALFGAATAHAKSTEAQVKALYDEGRAAYDAGRFAQAADLFEKCYTIAPRPALLWNIASSWQRQYDVDHKPDDLRNAREMYREFVRLEPSEQARTDALERIRRIEETLNAPSAPPPETETPSLLPVPSLTSAPGEAPPQPPEKRRHLGLWIGVGAGAAVAVVLAITLPIVLQPQDAAAPKVAGGVLTVRFP